MFLIATYSCLSAGLTLNRSFKYDLLTVYVPLVMILTISWLAFWINPREGSNNLSRVFIVVLCVLYASSLAEKLNSRLPRVEYTKAIDVWTGVNIYF